MITVPLKYSVKSGRFLFSCLGHIYLVSSFSLTLHIGFCALDKPVNLSTLDRIVSCKRWTLPVNLAWAPHFLLNLFDYEPLSLILVAYSGWEYDKIHECSNQEDHRVIAPVCTLIKSWMIRYGKQLGRYVVTTVQDELGIFVCCLCTDTLVCSQWECGDN